MNENTCAHQLYPLVPGIQLLHLFSGIFVRLSEFRLNHFSVVGKCTFINKLKILLKKKLKYFQDDEKYFPLLKTVYYYYYCYFLFHFSLLQYSLPEVSFCSLAYCHYKNLIRINKNVAVLYNTVLY